MRLCCGCGAEPQVLAPLSWEVCRVSKGIFFDTPTTDCAHLQEMDLASQVAASGQLPFLPEAHLAAALPSQSPPATDWQSSPLAWPVQGDAAPPMQSAAGPALRAGVRSRHSGERRARNASSEAAARSGLRLLPEPEPWDVPESPSEQKESVKQESPTSENGLVAALAAAVRRQQAAAEAADALARDARPGSP